MKGGEREKGREMKKGEEGVREGEMKKGGGRVRKGEGRVGNGGGFGGGERDPAGTDLQRSLLP